MSENSPVRLSLVSSSAEATQAIAAALADLVTDGDLVVLSGDLGAGKTCFTQGLGRGLGITDRITSPTFTLAQRYQGSLVLDHLDVYRIEQISDTLDLDLPELLEEGVTVIEWGEQILPVLGDEYLLIRIRHVDNPADDDETRHLELEAHGPSWVSRAARLDEALGRWRLC